MMANAFMSPSTTSGHTNIRHNILDVRPMREHSHGIYHKRIKHSHGRHSRNSMHLSATHDFLSSISVALSDPAPVDAVLHAIGSALDITSDAESSSTHIFIFWMLLLQKLCQQNK
jgi:hypothetical protein